MHTEILGCCMLGFVFKKRYCAWLRWGEQLREQTEDQTESDRQSDREALPHTHAVNVLSLTVSNSHSQMYYTIYIISNSSRTCSRCFDSPTGTESSDDLICVPLCSADITMYMLIKYKAIHHSHSMDETKLEYKLSNRSGIVISDLCVLVSVHFSAGASCPCADCSSAWR